MIKDDLSSTKRPAGKHLAPEAHLQKQGDTGQERKSREKRKRNSGQKRIPDRKRENARSQDTAAGRRAARLGQQRRPLRESRSVSSRELYQHILPYIEKSHTHNERSLKVGVWMLVILPVVLVLIQQLTGASRIAFLIIWIFGMFGIATALIFTAYSDHDLKKTLEEWKEIIPPEEEIVVNNLLPVDAEGEGWLIDPESLPIPLPNLSEKLPQMSDEFRERIANRETKRQKMKEDRKAALRNRRRMSIGEDGEEQNGNGPEVSGIPTGGKHLKHD